MLLLRVFFSVQGLLPEIGRHLMETAAYHTQLYTSHMSRLSAANVDSGHVQNDTGPSLQQMERLCKRLEEVEASAAEALRRAANAEETAAAANRRAANAEANTAEANRRAAIAEATLRRYQERQVSSAFVVV